MAQLLDTGNLVLIQNDDKRVVWQGFDYPTDNLIPHMKFGLNWRTGFNRFLTSWKSQTDPGTGKNSLRINASGSPQFFSVPGFRAAMEKRSLERAPVERCADDDVPNYDPC